MTIYLLYSKQLNYEFVDGDDFHPEENKALMRQGIGLNDDLRLPWLLSIYNQLRIWHLTKTNGVLACSALKHKYRRVLNEGIRYATSSDHDQSVKQDINDKYLHLNVYFVLLNCDKNLIINRLEHRHDHDIIKKESVASIIKSQFETLELPSAAQCVWSNESSCLFKEQRANESNIYYINVLTCSQIITVQEIVQSIVETLPHIL